MTKKKLLLLGGSSAQLVAIKRAKELGYETVLCDYLPDNPGKDIADVFYQVSTTDRDAVLEVAQREAVNGVVAYGSDPAAPTAAYVSERMNLPGLPYKTACSFCEKHLFRDFLIEHGFNAPGHLSVTGDACDDLDTDALTLPVIVKPSDSSGSKGVTVLSSWEGLPEAIRSAQKFSRNGVVEIEEFIEADHEGVIEGEIFVYEGEVVSWGIMRCLRDKLTNPLLPAGYRHPLDMADHRVSLVKESISALVKAGEIRFGAMNIEMVITKDEKLFFLDVGPRNGGNMLPYYMSLASGQDLVDGTLKCAMGDPWEFTYYDGACKDTWYMHVTHARTTGRFDRVEYSQQARDAMVYENVFLHEGDEVRPFMNSLDIVGLCIFKFGESSQLDAFLDDLDAHIVVHMLG